MIINIGDRKIGLNQPCFIIAELSANHNGSLEIALETIRAARRAGADAIKLQTYTADTITLDSKTDFFKIKGGTIWDGRYMHELYEEAHTPWQWHKALFAEAKSQGLISFSSPFDASAVDFLEELNVPAYKIASCEIVDIPLIEKVASTGKPIIISTGIASADDIELALETCAKYNNDQIILLQCTTSYPAKLENANLCLIPDFVKKFNKISGLSDHSLGLIAPVVAIALGAKVIEKHLILNKEIGGPDSAFSLSESEFKKMVDNVRDAEKSIGEVNYNLSDKKKEGRVFSKSIFISNDINKGELFTKENIRIVRPGDGIHPKHYSSILGKKSNVTIKMGNPLKLEYVD